MQHVTSSKISPETGPEMKQDAAGANALAAETKTLEVVELKAVMPEPVGLAPALKVHPTRSIPFFIFHAVAIIGVFLVPFAWKWVGLCVGMYYLRMFAITGGYHRYFSHRTYKTSRAFQFFMACLAQSSAQKGALWWAANHRHHHKFSDHENDIHSPLHTGFFWSHVGWILSIENDKTHWDLIPDFKKYPELVWLNKHHHVPAIALAVILFLLGGAPALMWGFFLSTTLLWHGTFTINSLSHVYGSRRYTTTDTSRNNLWFAILTMGEGWHNNHHTYQSSTNQGFFWWEIDPTYYILKGLSKVGIVWDLRNPPLALLEAKRIGKNGVRDAMPLTPAESGPARKPTVHAAPAETSATMKTPAAMKTASANETASTLRESAKA